MKKTLLLLGGFLVLSVTTASAQAPTARIKPSDKSVIKSSEVKQIPAESSPKEFKSKFRLTQSEYNQLPDYKKEYISRNPELFIITNEN